MTEKLRLPQQSSVARQCVRVSLEMFSYSGVIDGRYRREYIHPGFGFYQTRASVREERSKAVTPLAESSLPYAVAGMSTHS